MSVVAEVFKVLLLGIVEGITEWLPVSSTAHMLLLDDYITLNASEEFKAMFFVVVQLGAILAVAVTFWEKIFPFSFRKGESLLKKNVIVLWLKVALACVPSAIVGLLFDDWIDSNLHSWLVISSMLILYGVLFIVVERVGKGRRPKTKRIGDITWGKAFLIGCFQTLALVPGTSRSGATIIGALLMGVSRPAAAEFTFILAIPTMLGASLLKLIKFGFSFTVFELSSLILGMVTAYVVSLFVIKALLNYIRKHDFRVFGWYRTVLGLLLMVYFTVC